jgi:hypothetical protein
MLRSAISAFTRVFDALCLAAWCAADTGVICSRLCGEQRNRTMLSLSSGAHSRDPLASPGERCSASDMRI